VVDAFEKIYLYLVSIFNNRIILREILFRRCSVQNEKLLLPPDSYCLVFQHRLFIHHTKTALKQAKKDLGLTVWR